MIRRLYIKDFVLIDTVELDFSNGFTVITGETGAGKSILIGAISLILGARSDVKNIRQGASKSIVECEIDLSSVESLSEVFRAHDLDYSSSCILRREVTQQGKSRAFINDTPVTTALLKEVGGHLVDIHSQHHNMMIGEELFQMGVVDLLAGNTELLSEYRRAYTLMVEVRRRLREERQRLDTLSRDMDYLQHQHRQLQEAELQEGEDERIEERLGMAEYAQEISENLHGVAALSEDTSDGHPSPYSLVARYARGLASIASHFPSARELSDRLEELSVEIKDLSYEASSRLDEVEIDREEIQSLEARNDLIQSLLYKHRLRTVAELIALREELSEKIATADNAEEYLRELTQELKKSTEEVEVLASRLSRARRKATSLIIPDLHVLMEELGIAGATFEIRLTDLDECGEMGKDRVDFLFATNKQATLRPIREIASGGEISRFMLALKTILSSRTTLPTVIFDEIDTGVSGEIAAKIGHVMSRLSEHIQVLAITHLPQIAALGATHLVVRKEERDGGYISLIEEVRGEDREREIAGMLSGQDLSKEAIENARVLLKNKEQL